MSLVELPKTAEVARALLAAADHPGEVIPTGEALLAPLAVARRAGLVEPDPSAVDSAPAPTELALADAVDVAPPPAKKAPRKRAAR